MDKKKNDIIDENNRIPLTIPPVVAAAARSTMAKLLAAERADRAKSSEIDSLTHTQLLERVPARL
jgi:hypothetical protein